MINYNLKINFQDEKVLSSDITFVSGDVGAYKLIFDFYDNGKKVDISKYTLSVKAKRADGVKIASAGEIENGQAVFIPESNIYAVPGDLYLEVALCDGAGKYITAKVIIASVIEGLGETDVKGTETPSVYVTLLGNLQSKIDQANQLIQNSIPIKGVDYFDGIDGKDGVDGYTPIKGVDYLTEAEINEICNKTDEKAKTLFANAVYGAKNGEIVKINDINPLDASLDLSVSADAKITVSGKNLISYPFNDTTVTRNGVTFTDNGDGTVTANGTATARASFVVASGKQSLNLPKSKYFLSGCPAGGSSNTYYFDAQWYKNGVFQRKFADEGNGRLCNVSVVERSDIYFYIIIESGTTVENLTFCPQFEEGGSFTGYENPISNETFDLKSGNVEHKKASSHTTTIYSDTDGAILLCEYKKDINKVIEKLTNAIISLGGNV